MLKGRLTEHAAKILDAAYLQDAFVEYEPKKYTPGVTDKILYHGINLTSREKVEFTIKNAIIPLDDSTNIDYQFDFFISAAIEYRTTADAIKKQLNDKNFKVVTAYDLRTGIDQKKQIRELINKSKNFIVLLTYTYVSKPPIENEYIIQIDEDYSEEIDEKSKRLAIPYIVDGLNYSLGYYTNKVPLRVTDRPLIGYYINDFVVDDIIKFYTPMHSNIVTYIKCSLCGAINNDKMLYCGDCGKSLQQQNTCSKCGNPTTNKFCSKCGHPTVKLGTPQSIQANQTWQNIQSIQQNSLLENRWKLLEKKAEGGFGEIWKGVDTRYKKTTKYVAIKRLLTNGLNQIELQEAIDSFEQEADMLLNLKHMHLPIIYDQFEYNNEYYLVMDWIEGETLDAYIQKNSPLQIGVSLKSKEFFFIFHSLIDVLEYLHQQNPQIIFRDLKPSNIMLVKNTQDEVIDVKLIDFGIARHFKPGQIKDTIALGSIGYAAPEQHGKSQTSEQSDVYAFGATMHQVLTKEDPSNTPFHFSTLNDPTLNSFLEKCTAIKQNDRFSTMAEVRQAFQNIEYMIVNTGKQLPKQIQYTTNLPSTNISVGKILHSGTCLMDTTNIAKWRVANNLYNGARDKAIIQNSKLPQICMYSHQKDEYMMTDLYIGFSTYIRQNLLEIHLCRNINEREDELSKADIIVLGISQNFLADDYSYAIMQLAMDRFDYENIRVIPLLLRSTNYANERINVVQMLPRSGKPMNMYKNKEVINAEIVREIFNVSEEVRKVK